MEKRRVRNNIRRLRFFQNEMTQEELAEKTGVTRQTINAKAPNIHPRWSWRSRSRLSSGCHWKKYSPTRPAMTLLMGRKNKVKAM